MKLFVFLMCLLVSTFAAPVSLAKCCFFFFLRQLEKSLSMHLNTVALED